MGLKEMTKIITLFQKINDYYKILYFYNIAN